jgi:hypothetical protein
MKVILTRFLLLLTAIAIPIAAAPTLATVPAPLRVCVQTGAGTACESPHAGLHAVRPMEIR